MVVTTAASQSTPPARSTGRSRFPIRSRLGRVGETHKPNLILKYKRHYKNDCFPARRNLQEPYAIVPFSGYFRRWTRAFTLWREGVCTCAHDRDLLQGSP